MHPLRFRRLGLAELDGLAAIELDPDQVERFLGPVADIVAAVRRGPAHSLTAVETEAGLAGFYVVHPDRRDGACWWLGWLAMDRRQQGHGYGGLTMRAILDRLRGVPHCRRVRLLVAADNTCARRLYSNAGFRLAGLWASTGELVLELVLRPSCDLGRLLAMMLCAVALHARRVFRNWRLRQTVGPHAAGVIGVERGPPSSFHQCTMRPLRRRRAGGFTPAFGLG